MKEYLIKSIVSALVFAGFTLALDAIFSEISSFWKYMISGLLFGFLSTNDGDIFLKRLFSRDMISSVFRKLIISLFK